MHTISLSTNNRQHKFKMSSFTYCRLLSKRLQIELFLSWMALSMFSCIRKWKFFPSKVCLKVLNYSRIRKFRHGKSTVLSAKLNDGRACWPHIRRSTHRVWTQIVYYTPVCHNETAPLLRFVVELLYSCPAVDRFRLTARSCGLSAAGPQASFQMLLPPACGWVCSSNGLLSSASRGRG